MAIDFDSRKLIQAEMADALAASRRLTESTGGAMFYITDEAGNPLGVPHERAELARFRVRAVAAPEGAAPEHVVVKPSPPPDPLPDAPPARMQADDAFRPPPAKIPRRASTEWESW